jgi:predicted metal-binding protein
MMVATAPWVRLKCQYGCEYYNKSLCCPPDAPTPEETKTVLDCYTKAILLHIESPPIDGPEKILDREKILLEFCRMAVDLEIKAFKDGYRKAFSYLAGPCLECFNFKVGKLECAKLGNKTCNHPLKARPAMEACGIDVYQTAHNCGLPVHTLDSILKTQNKYCLILIE